MCNLGCHFKVRTVTDIGGMCNNVWKIPCMSEREKFVWIGLPHNIVQGHAFVNNVTKKIKFLDHMSKHRQFKEDPNY